ncbi:MAG: hypothetical protein HKN40_07905 [Winogradskyella sp.]|uniref:DUF5689 domain-containing protein n=1 Tax=Winogradskyella sp. TaxID=1883156 RepID=UPI00183F6233|nr:hypothetical protein [Winogradskyella sp.]
MKTLKINKIILLLIGLVVFNSCVQDDEFNTPDTSIVEPNIPENQKVQISALAGELAQAQGNSTLDYSDEDTTYSYIFGDTDLYMEGYVISSDEGGNFFEEIIIQNNFENPTIGIKLLIDVNPLFVRYGPGRKVYVKLNGLSVGITNGVLTLGVLNGNEVDKIPSAAETSVIFRSATKETLVPLPLTFAEFSADKTNLYIQLQDVQFNRNLVNGDSPATYASEASDSFDGERTLESCAAASSVIFSTSTFADFKALTLPSGRGSMNVILTRNFFGDTFNVVVNSPEDINFEDVARCDPDFLECTGPSGGGSAFFSENFEGFGGYAAEGWTNVNVSGGSTEWITGSFSGSTYAQISGFNSGDDEINVWLVTPTINMDGTTGEELSFDVQANFDNGTILTVLVSTDFTGDPLTATWQPLDADIPVGPSSGFGSFTGVGPINVSCIDGDVNFAFYYEGSDPSATTRYHVDNIEVTGN